MGFLTDTAVQRLRDLARSGYVLVGAVFFLTSGKPTQFGCLLVGHLFPIYNTLAALSAAAAA